MGRMKALDQRPAGQAVAEPAQGTDLVKLAFRLDADLLAYVDAIAINERCSRSDVLRRCVARDQARGNRP